MRAGLTPKMTLYASVGFISNDQEVECGEEEILEVETEEPVQNKSQLSDYVGGADDIFHKRIAEAIQNMNPEGVKFHPVRLDGWKGNIFDDYVCVVTYDNIYKLLNKELSDYFSDDDDEDEDYNIHKFVLDKKELSQIPLSKRLVMRAREMPGYTLYHQSVVDAINALEPIGMKFYNFEKETF